MMNRCSSGSFSRSGYSIGPAISSPEGASVMAVIFLIAIITVVGVVFVSLLTTGIEESLIEVDSTRALYVAEAGIEAAMGHLKRSPTSTNWLWNDGYLNKSVGSGTVDVEILQYENRDGTLASSNRCEEFTSSIEAAGANPARTVYIMLNWTSSNGFGLELYDNAVADCNNPLASAGLIVSLPLSTDRPRVIRYRIPDAAPADITYTARVLGTGGDSFNLRIAHPDEPGFVPANNMRAIIAEGRVRSVVREVFVAFSRTP